MALNLRNVPLINQSNLVTVYFDVKLIMCLNTNKHYEYLKHLRKLVFFFLFRIGIWMCFLATFVIVFFLLIKIARTCNVKVSNLSQRILCETTDSEVLS